MHVRVIANDVQTLIDFMMLVPMIVVVVVVIFAAAAKLLLRTSVAD